jgi:hypothetical protein
VKLSLGRDVTVAVVETGVVIFDGRRGEYWQLNESAGLALRALLDGGSLDEAAERMSGAASVPPQRAVGDVRALVDSLREAKLVVVSP